MVPPGGSSGRVSTAKRNPGGTPTAGRGRGREGVSGSATRNQSGQFRGHQWAETVAISGQFRGRLWAVFHGRGQPSTDKALTDLASSLPPAKAATEAVAAPHARDEFGQRTLAGLRLLARSATRQVPLPKFIVEPLLLAIWQDCGGGDEPVSVEKIQQSIKGQQEHTADPTIQKFYEQLSSRLSPPLEDATND